MKNFKNVTKRGLAALLALVMIVGTMSLTAFAADEGTDEEIDVSYAFDKVIDEIKDEFIDSDQKAADDLLKGTYDALNPDAESSQDKDIYDEDGKVKGEVLDQVDAANESSEKLEEDLKDTVIVDKETGKTLDELMDEKAINAADAAQAGADAVDEANKAMENLEELVNAGDTDAVDEIAKAVGEQAAIAEKAYEDAAKAYNDAEAALNAAKAQYNKVVEDALAEAVAAGKITAEELAEMTDDQKAEKAIGLVNEDLTAAQTALGKAQENLKALEETRNKAENAKVIAEKYQAIAEKLAENPEKLTNADVIAILLNKETWEAELDKLLEALDEENLDDEGLADAAVDHALAQKNLEKAEQDLKDFKGSDEAKKAEETIDEINDAISEAQKLIETLKNAEVVLGDTNELKDQLEMMSSLLTDLQAARETLQNPAATEQEKSAAKAKQDEAMTKLFVNDGIGGGLWGKSMPLVGRFYQGVEWDGLSYRRWDFVGSANVEAAKALCALLMGKTVKDPAGSVWEKEAEVQKSGYDQKLSTAQKSVNDAQAALDDVNLAGALTDYLETIGKEDGADAAAAAEKAAQLAAVLRGISDEAVEAAQKKAAEAAEAAQKAAEDLAAAQKAYAAAVEALNEKKVNSILSGLDMAGLFGTAEEKLAEAKEALEKAENAKEEADRAKEEADNAVTEAEENRDRIENVITGGGSGSGNVEIEIDDVAIPLSSGPVTRAEFVDYLWRHEGSPAASLPTFVDVPADHEYAVAIGWAQANGLVTGNEEGAFEPDELVTVAAVRTILGNFARVFGTNVVAADDLTTLTGDEDEAVLNCDEVIAEFFGEEYATMEDAA